MAGVQSIERAFAILRTLSAGPAGVTELAEQVDLPKSTVARLLSALEAEGVVEQSAVGRAYQLGPGINELAGTGRGGRTLSQLARPYLEELSDRTGESSGLDILQDGWVHFVSQIEAEQDVQVRDWTGESGRAHTLPAGLVMLAHANAASLADYLKSDLVALTSHTIVDPDALRERLVQARSAGYAWGFEEFADGINSVAAPVFNADGVVAALRVHGPTFRFPDPNEAHDLGLLVAQVASRFSDKLKLSAQHPNEG